jgi:hypothetical protein
MSAWNRRGAWLTVFASCAYIFAIDEPIGTALSACTLILAWAIGLVALIVGAAPTDKNLLADWVTSVYLVFSTFFVFFPIYKAQLGWAVELVGFGLGAVCFCFGLVIAILAYSPGLTE